MHDRREQPDGSATPAGLGSGLLSTDITEERRQSWSFLRSSLRQLPGIRGLAGCDRELALALQDTWTVLDVGCGSGSRSAPRALARSIGVDVHLPSLAEVQKQGTRVSTVCASLEVLPVADAAVDAVVALDVIEHFVKQRAHGLLLEFERVARKAIVLLTPNGYLPQGGTIENPFMEHLSGWSVLELEAHGYSVSGVNGWRPLRGSFAIPRFGTLGKALSLASQPVVRRYPGQAFHLLAVKHL